MGQRQNISVVFANEFTRNWKADLSSSQVFLCLLTPEYLRSPECWEHLQYARLLGKPVRVALIAGTVIPPGFFAGVQDLEIQPCASPKEVAAYAERVARALQKEP
jgi:hypothetical protein